MKTFNLLKKTLFSLIFLLGQSNISAKESDWGLYENIDELTGKKNTLLIYKTKIPNTSKGILELEITCDKTPLFGVIMEKKTKYNPNLYYELSIYDAPGLQPNIADRRYYGPFRVLNADGTIGLRGISSGKYSNVFEWNSPSDDDFSKSTKKLELIFSNGQKLVIEYGEKHNRFSKECFHSEKNIP